MKTLGPLALILLLYQTTGFAQYKVHYLYEGNGYSDWSITTGDLDGDADQDVVIGYYDGSRIYWFENIDGKGTFHFARTVTDSVYFTTSLFTADIDHDGDLDIVSSSSFDSKVAWYENLDGEGNFGPQIMISDSADQASSVFVCDVDGDGDNDVISSGWGADQIAWFENADGQGNFSTLKVIGDTIDGANNVCAGDLDGDGDWDVIASSTYPYRIYIYENPDGKGNFVLKDIIDVVDYCLNKAYAFDMDGDKDLDIVAHEAGICNLEIDIVWYENLDGTGNYGPARTISSSLQIFAIDAGDLDNDEDLDILAYNRYTVESSAFSVGWFENIDGKGNFGPFNDFPGMSNIAKDVCIADMDGDGDNDALAAHYHDDMSAWYENLDGKGDFSANMHISPMVSIQSTDLNSDGYADIVSCFQDDGEISWFENLAGSGGFSDRKSIICAGTDLYTFCIADVDGDSDKDIIASSTYQRKLAWYENTDGKGSFGDQHVIAASSFRPTSIVSCDLDGDDDNDIIATSVDTNIIVWLENSDGKGNFGTEHVIYSDLIYVATIYACDLDGDLDFDVLTGSAVGDLISWFENMDGDGNFGTENIITTDADGVWSVFAVDLDGDGDNDIISGSGNDHKLAWYENMDNGSFGSQTVLSTSLMNIRSIYSVDIDNDEDFDILVASQDDDRISWLINDGHGNFTSPKHMYYLEGVSSIIADHLNLDGKPDFIAATTLDNQILWFDNLILGLEKPAYLEMTVIYPNPSNGLMHIDLGVNDHIEAVTIYDLQGRTVFMKTHMLPDGLLDLSHLGTGSYLMRIDMADKTLINKIVIE